MKRNISIIVYWGIALVLTALWISIVREFDFGLGALFGGLLGALFAGLPIGASLWGHKFFFPSPQNEIGDWFDNFKQNGEMPKWLAVIQAIDGDLAGVALPLTNILTNSLYYPSCGFDGRPVQFMAGFVHSFLYVDYGRDRDDLLVKINKKHLSFKGYSLYGRRAVTVDELAPRGWRPVLTPGPADSERAKTIPEGFNKEPYCEWMIFDRDADKNDAHGPKRFSLIYLCADGVATYQALYLQNNLAPRILSIIQPGHGFGGNYTDFTDPTGLFANTVMRATKAPVPEYLIHGGLGTRYPEACWPDDYPELVGYFQRQNGNGMWRRPTQTQ